MSLIQRMSQQSLDDGLPADIQLPGFLIEFLQHWQRKVHVDTLNRRYLLALVREKAGDVPSFVCEVRNLIGCRRFWRIRCF